MKGFRVEGKRERVLESNRAWLDTGDIIRRNSRGRHFRKRWFMRNSEIECQLYRGLDKYPRTQLMTCSEMSKANSDLSKVFIAALDRGEEKPLWSWKMIDPKKFNRDLRAHVLSPEM